MPSGQFELMDQVSVEIDYIVRERLPELQVTVTVSKEGVDLFHAFDTDDEAEIQPTEAGRYRAKYVIPKRILKEGLYNLRITAGLPHKLIQDINSGVVFEIVNNTINTQKRSFRQDRQGLLASPGVWTRVNLSE